MKRLRQRMTGAGLILLLKIRNLQLWILERASDRYLQRAEKDLEKSRKMRVRALKLMEKTIRTMDG